MADDVSVAIGATTDTFESAIGTATSAMESLVTGPVKALGAAFGDLESLAGDAFGAIKTAVDASGTAIEEMAKVAVSSLVSAASGAGNFSAALGKIIAVVGGGTIAAAFTAITGILTFANKEMAELVSHAEQYGLSITRLQQLQYAASLNGVGSSTFNTGVEKFVDLLDEAGRKENDLTKLFDANNVHWKDLHGHVLDTSTAMAQVATLVQHAATYSQAVKIAEWAGFSREMVPFLRQGATAIGDMAKAAPVVSDALARQQADFARQWQQAVAQWTAIFQNAIIFISGLLRGLATIASAILGGLGTGIKNLATTIYNLDPAVKEAQTAVSTFGERFDAVIKNNSTNLDTFTDEFRAAAAKAFAFGSQGPATKLLPEEQKANKDMIRSSREAAEEQIRLADLVFAQTKEKLEAAVKVHRLTADQASQQEIAAVNVRLAAEKAALAKEDAIDGQSLAQHQANLNKLKTIEQKAMNDIQKIRDQALEKDVQSWNTELGKIQGAWDSQLKGLLAGTTTWSQAMKNIFADLILDVIKEFEKAAIEKAALGLAGGLGGVGTGGLGGLLFGLLGKAIPGFQEGAWNIPSQTLALLHPGEMVMPAGPAQQFRDNAAVGPAGGASISMNLSAIDSTGLQAMINRITPQIARSLQSYQALNPSAQ
jgi:hypothetical protein